MDHCSWFFTCWWDWRKVKQRPLSIQDTRSIILYINWLWEKAGVKFGQSVSRLPSSNPQESIILYTLPQDWECLTLLYLGLIQFHGHLASHFWFFHDSWVLYFIVVFLQDLCHILSHSLTCYSQLVNFLTLQWILSIHHNSSYIGDICKHFPNFNLNVKVCLCLTFVSCMQRIVGMRWFAIFMY